MPVRGRCDGFYEGVGRPQIDGPLPPDVAAVRRGCGWFFHSAPPTPEEAWRAQAEQRWIAAAAIRNHLPPDTAPEVVLLASVDEEGELTAWEDYRRACVAAEYAERRAAGNASG